MIRRQLKIKVCGMKYSQNIREVAALQPDYMGFIFYERSKRNFTGTIPVLSEKIKKTGVFVDSGLDFILEKIQKLDLKAVQLHGDESVSFCKQLRSETNENIEIIKVFSVAEDFDFNAVTEFEDVSDFFLFDTKGKEKGGNGIVFDWKLLSKNKSSKPFFLSGGIGPESYDDLISFFQSDMSLNCVAIDLNSRFEIEPGLKDAKKLTNFIKRIKSIQ